MDRDMQAQAEMERGERIAELLHRMEFGMTTKQDANDMAALIGFASKPRPTPETKSNVVPF